MPSAGDVLSVIAYFLFFLLVAVIIVAIAAFMRDVGKLLIALPLLSIALGSVISNHTR